MRQNKDGYDVFLSGNRPMLKPPNISLVGTVDIHKAVSMFVFVGVSEQGQRIASAESCKEQCFVLVRETRRARDEPYMILSLKLMLTSRDISYRMLLCPTMTA